MFKSSLQKFIVKRTALLLVWSATAAVLFGGSGRLLLLAGLVAGTLAGIGRFAAGECVLKRVCGLTGGKAAVAGAAAFTLYELVLLAALALAYFLNVLLFYGLLAGFLLVPVIIILNSLTEAAGITRNHFEQGGD